MLRLCPSLRMSAGESLRYAVWRSALVAGALFLATVRGFAIPAAPEGAVETGSPSFVVLGPESLGLAAAPVDIKSMPDGRVLVIAQRDIAFGDGVRWETYHAGEGEQPIMASVAVDDDGAIYTGVPGGFAELELKAGGRWILNPVVELPEEAETQKAPLISVVPLEEHWYWYGGNGAIVSWRPGVDPRTTGHLSGIGQIFTLGGENFVSDGSSGGLFRLKDEGGLESMNAASRWVSEGITCATPYSEGLLLVGTGSAGLKLFNGTSFTPFGEQGLIGRGYRITDVCPIGDNYFAAAIDSFGIIFFDREGHMVQVLDRSLDHRLARAKRLLYTKTGVLWGLLSDGLARVQFPSPVSNFEPLLPSGLRYAEPMRYRGHLWMLADGRALRGVYDDHGRLETFESDTPPGSYLFTLTVIDGELFASSNEGVFLRRDGSWESILPGVRNARLGVAPSTRDQIYYVARGEYGVIRRTSRGFEADSTPMPDLGDSYGSKIDANGIGWLELGTSKAGRFDASTGKPDFKAFGSSEGLSTLGWVEIFILDGIARLHVSNRLYRFNGKDGFIEDLELLSTLPQLAQATGRPTTDSAGRLWYTMNGVLQVIDRSSPNNGQPLDVAHVGFSPIHYTAEDDGVMWMFEPGHLARFDPRIKPIPDAPLKALITSVQFSTSSRSVYEPGTSLGRIDYSDNSLVFNFAAPSNPSTGTVTFEVMLEGSGNQWVSTGTLGSTGFNRLKEDTYKFRVRPVLAGVRHGEEATLSFSIAPPWYRTTTAWIAYASSALGLLVFIGWFSSFLQRRENERLEKVVAQRTSELIASNSRLNQQIEETTRKSVALGLSEERFRVLNGELEQRVRQRTSELEELHKQLVAASRTAGMAEVATGVLHNVGNVLNSVNVSATLVRDTLRLSEVSSLGRVAAMIRDHAADAVTFLSTHPKGKLIPGFIVELATQLEREHETIRAESEQLTKNIEHIKGVVSMQQSFAAVSGMREEVDVAALVIDAFRIHQNSLNRHGIDVVHEHPPLPPVVIDKHKVLQILVNLVQNAKRAITDTGRNGGRIVTHIAIDDEERVRISITDDGVGIPSENLVRIFSHGFTTRANGHGFGLHSGANAAREMGGSLRAESDGSGLGATFTLEFPVSVAKATA